MAIQIDTFSRLNYSTLVKGSNGTKEVEWWDLPFIRPIAPAPDDTLVQVKSHDRIDRLSKKYLENPVLWDVIAEINGFRLLPMALKFGDMIRIPSEIRTVNFIRSKDDQ